MALDPSIITQAQVPQPNLLQTVGQLQALTNAANQNRIFQAEQAGGAALLQGGGDPERTRQLLMSNPQAAIAAPEILSAALTQQGQRLTNTGAQVANLRRVAGTVPYRADGTPDVVGGLARINEGVQAGLYTADQAATLAGQGDKLASFMRQSAISGDAGPNAMAAQGMGTPDTINTGGAQVTTQFNPVTHQRTFAGGPAASIANTLTPEGEAAPRSYTDASGVTHTVPTSSVVTPTGVGKETPGVSGPGGSLTTGLPPGAGEARAAQGQASGVQYATELAGSAQTQTLTAQLKEVDALLQKPQGATGPGTQVVNSWRNFALGNLPLLLKANPNLNAQYIEQSATQDELKKYMTQIALQQSGAFGPSTNDKLAAAASGNANPDMSNLANRDVTRMNLALTRAQQARLAAFQASGQPAEQYSTWASGWNRTVDPRAFMLDVLSPPERQKLLDTITSDAGRKALVKGRMAAEDAGLYQQKDIPR